MIYTVYYHHTFGANVFFGTKKRVIEKAIEIIKEDFEEQTLPITGKSVYSEEKIIFEEWEELIEEIQRISLLEWWRMKKEDVIIPFIEEKILRK